MRYLRCENFGNRLLFPPRHHLGGETPTTTPNRYAAAVASSTVTVSQEDGCSSAAVASSTVTVSQEDGCSCRLADTHGARVGV